MILPVYLYGQPVLREEAKEVPKDYPELKKLVADMFETMYKAEGVGLAGPQVGLSLRLFAVDVDPLKEDYPECEGVKRFMINPEIYERNEKTNSLEEGCLSVPGINESVSRSISIRVTYYDVDWNKHDEAFVGFAARCVQHEYEHLQGHLFIDNISAIRRQLDKNRLKNIVKGKVRTHYKVKMQRSTK